jgi:tRNA(adenine34) deaminase
MEQIDVFNDEYFMKQALREAQLAYEADEVPVGAVIVSNKRIIGRGHNLVERLVDVTAHAEVQAITAATGHLGAKYLKDCTLYVTLEPCPMCAGALFWSQIGKVLYAARDPKRGFIENGGKLHRGTVLEQGPFEAEASDLLKKYFLSKRL